MPAVLSEKQLTEFREKICVIASQQFAELGAEKVSMRSIAKALGYSATALYSYFENKDAILMATRARAYLRLAGRLEEAMQNNDDLWAVSRAIGDAYIQFARDEPAAYQLIFAFQQPHQSPSPELTIAENRANYFLVEYVRSMVKAGLLEGDPVRLAHVYWAGMHGLIQLEMVGKFSMEGANFEDLRHEMMRLITRGARPS